MINLLCRKEQARISLIPNRYATKRYKYMCKTQQQTVFLGMPSKCLVQYLVLFSQMYMISILVMTRCQFRYCSWVQHGRHGNTNLNSKITHNICPPISRWGQVTNQSSQRLLNDCVLQMFVLQDTDQEVLPSGDLQTNKTLHLVGASPQTFAGRSLTQSLATPIK